MEQAEKVPEMEYWAVEDHPGVFYVRWRNPERLEIVGSAGLETRKRGFRPPEVC